MRSFGLLKTLSKVKRDLDVAVRSRRNDRTRHATAPDLAAGRLYLNPRYPFKYDAQSRYAFSKRIL
jgi:hypothetical protein